MKQFYEAILDRLIEVEKHYESEPYECGWADEAIAFFSVDEISGSAKAKFQISPDGIHWADDSCCCKKDEKTVEFSTPGVHYLKAHHFGGFLRVVMEATGRVKMTVQLALKG